MGQLVERTNTDLREAQLESVKQFLTFQIQDETFGLDILPIKEIIEYGKITNVPMVPPYVRGVINLRGNVVPVIDLPVRFGWEPSSVTKRTCIVIIEIVSGEDEFDIGVVIDSVNEVLEIAEDNIEPAPSFGARIRTDFICGMGKVNDEFVVLLNPNKVLAIEELAQLEDLSRKRLEA